MSDLLIGFFGGMMAILAPILFVFFLLRLYPYLLLDLVINFITRPRGTRAARIPTHLE